jgi:hypothetical protein
MLAGVAGVARVAGAFVAAAAAESASCTEASFLSLEMRADVSWVYC